MSKVDILVKQRQTDGWKYRNNKKDKSPNDSQSEYKMADRKRKTIITIYVNSSVLR